MRKFGKFLLGAIIGGVVGSSLVLLFAPDTGENVRREIGNYFKNLQEEAQRASEEKRIEMEAELRELRSSKKIVE